MEIARTRADIVVSQRKYVIYPLKETDLAFILEKHIHAASRIWRYLNSIPDKGMFLNIKKWFVYIRLISKLSDSVLVYFLFIAYPLYFYLCILRCSRLVWLSLTNSACIFHLHCTVYNPNMSKIGTCITNKILNQHQRNKLMKKKMIETQMKMK
jgi:hypothetical protein